MQGQPQTGERGRQTVDEGRSLRPHEPLNQRRGSANVLSPATVSAYIPVCRGVWASGTSGCCRSEAQSWLSNAVQRPVRCGTRILVVSHLISRQHLFHPPEANDACVVAGERRDGEREREGAPASWAPASVLRSRNSFKLHAG